MKPVNGQVMELIRLQAEGLAGESEVRELETLMQENPDLVACYVEYLMLDEALADRAKENEGAGDRITTVDFAGSRARKWKVVSVGWAAAAAIILGLTVLWWQGPSQPDAVRVVEVEDAELEGHAGPLEPGAAIPLSRIELKSGRMVVMLSSGVRLEMLAPFHGVLLDAMHVRLDSGRLNADVGEQGKGFTVSTDAGDVIDLGTSFGIEADEDGECRVAVFSGEVELRPKQTEGSKQRPPTIRLTEGQAARFSALAGLRRWWDVALAAKEAGISSKPYKGVVATIRDNLGNWQDHPFYGMVQGGMREGALAYTDKPRPAWQAPENGTFPSFLEGADLIRTYHHFRWELDYQLRIKLRGPAEVFVLRDSRTEAPEWLRANFEDTGARLRVGPWNPAISEDPGVLWQDGEPYFPVAVWRRTAEAGMLELGPSRASEADEVTLMYGIAVRDLSRK